LLKASLCATSPCGVAVCDGYDVYYDLQRDESHYENEHSATSSTGQQRIWPCNSKIPRANCAKSFVTGGWGEKLAKEIVEPEVGVTVAAMDKTMSQKTRDEVLAKLKQRYKSAGLEHKQKLLNQAQELLGYHRKSAIRALRAPVVERGMWGRGQEATLAALKDMEANLPFALLGLDSDNGGEFINHHVMRWSKEPTARCATTFTRASNWRARSARTGK
jgi:hypothetical protein